MGVVVIFLNIFVFQENVIFCILDETAAASNQFVIQINYIVEIHLDITQTYCSLKMFQLIKYLK